MEKRAVKSKTRYILAFLIGTLIFVLGFALTYSIAHLEYQRIVQIQDPISYEIFNDKLKHTLFNKDICSEETFQEVSIDLAFQGGIIGRLEEKLGKDDEGVLFRKKFYSLIQLEHFEYVKSINKECDKNINTILFFYSNKKDDLKKSEGIGSILSVLYERNKEDLVIYSFDMNLNSELITLLKEKYDVETPVTIIINEEHILNQIDNLEQIESLLT